jgi:hypothetical protein
MAGFQLGGKWAAYQETERIFQKKSGQQPVSCQFMNSAACHALWREYHAKLHEYNGGETPWEALNARIVSNLHSLCEKHAGRRIVVVFGAAHGYFLLDALSKAPAVRLVDVESFFPLEQTEIEAATTPKDYLLALRPLNFGQVDPAALPRLRRFLEKIKNATGLDGDYHNFRGKLLLHERDFAGAIKEFQTVAALDRSRVSAFDETSRLTEMGQFNVAWAEQLSGDVSGARRDYEMLVASPDISPQTKDVARQYLAALPAPKQTTRSKTR